jgi:hypothetical protein
MVLNYDGAPHRTQLNFGTEGLSAREEILLKSLIRLLDHRTQQQWTYHPESADLWLLGKGSCIPPAALANGKVAQTLTLVSDQSLSNTTLSFPLKPDHIEQALNRIGSLLLGSPAITRTEQPIPTEAFTESYRLVRWPAAALVDNPESIRMSALLLGPPLTLAEITQRANLPGVVCADFLSKLMHAGFVLTTRVPVATTATMPPTSEATVQLGLFARIRQRLMQKK